MSNPDYRKIFEDLEADCPESEDLNKLATVMSGESTFPDATISARLLDFFSSKPKPIPAGYTYLSQFITHDISFDKHSDRHVRADRPWEVMDPEKIKELKNLRKPNFDLETLYGYEVPINEGEIPRAELMQKSSLPLLKIDYTLTASETGGHVSYPCDLPRKEKSAMANIVDPRNDENLLLAQTMVAFIKFHNAMVVNLNESGTYTYKQLFEKARKLTIRYYQTIILTDFLARIVQEPVLKYVRQNLETGKLFYKPKPDDIFIPLEFSVAAFRFGHSMIRRVYELNKINPETSLYKIMVFTGRGNMDFNPNRFNLPSIWIINWNLFYEINGSKFNAALDIDTKLPLDLLRLRPLAVDDNSDGRASSLAALDLFRGRRFGLPTGQDVAETIYGNGAHLSAEQISKLLLSKQINYTPKDEADRIRKRLSDVFSKKTPLWFYILAEAELQNDGKLGAVGSRIVAETVIQLLYHSEYSILREEWKSGEDFLLNNGTFDMPGMLRFIQAMGQKHFNALYPGMTSNFDELNPLG